MESASFRAAPVFKIDLSLPPHERWVAVSKAYRGVLPGLVKEIWAMLGVSKKEIKELCSSFAEQAQYALLGVDRADILQEIKGLSSGLGVEYDQLLTLNMQYEMCANCTAIVGRTSKGVALGRTLDWEFPQLKKVTIQVEFLKRGKLLYTCTTWAGYAGVFTAVNNAFGYALAINFRENESQPNERISQSGYVASDLADHVADDVAGVAGDLEKMWPIGVLARDVLENAKSYDEVILRLSSSGLIAPVYFIVSDHKQGIVLTRNRIGECARMCLEDEKGGSKEVGTGCWGMRSTLLQANMDHWTKDPRIDKQQSLPRIKVASSILYPPRPTPPPFH
ncbi:hypothetical protein AAMO2058_000177200 [Amorphochlora amoebiformis]